ncbi:hypothetical protein HAPAU_38620 [Halalkalicoccus paucihalophilus]|uniref:Uncharacterized protein n=1 Tax=Halalkalicoccus paucihalophilus TaxID=1008153 RepID=A0A151A839_9EURY|nr:hypothetical protein HAPAU_38620 [Halalkalicoccus paucihalophilus]
MDFLGKSGGSTHQTRRASNSAAPGLEICQIHICERIKELEATDTETLSDETGTEPADADIPVEERQSE